MDFNETLSALQSILGRRVSVMLHDESSIILSIVMKGTLRRGDDLMRDLLPATSICFLVDPLNTFTITDRDFHRAEFDPRGLVIDIASVRFIVSVRGDWPDPYVLPAT